MVTKRYSFEIGHPHESGPLVVLDGHDGRVRVASLIECRVRDEQRKVTAYLAVDTAPAAQRVRELLVVVDDDAEPLTAQELQRLPVAKYVEAVVERALWRVEDFPPGLAATSARERAGGAIRALPSFRVEPVVDDGARLLRTARSSSRRPRQRRPMTPGRLAEVARLYREALDDPTVKSTARYVAEKLGLEAGESSARKLIARARSEGFLGPAVGKKAGEIRQEEDR